MKRAIFCAALAASACVGVTAARAEDGHMRVKLGDLNLATAEGAKIALARIAAQAGGFCDVSPGRETLERAAETQRCVADMTRKAVAQLDAPVVTALLEGRPLDGSALALK